MSCLPHNSAWYWERWLALENQLAETEDLIGVSIVENGSDKLQLMNYAKEIRYQMDDYEKKYNIAKRNESGNSNSQKLNSYQYGTMG